MTVNTIMEYHHKQHRQWMSALDFYQDEIKIFQKELGKVLFEFPDTFSIIEHVDEYRDILLKKLEKIDVFRKQIILHEKNMKGTEFTSKTFLWTEVELREKINAFIEQFENLKLIFRNFVSKHLSHA